MGGIYGQRQGSLTEQMCSCCCMHLYHSEEYTQKQEEFVSEQHFWNYKFSTEYKLNKLEMISRPARLHR